MERWQNKVAVVTGASSGIGDVVARDLVEAGLIVVAVARRESKLLENQKLLSEKLRSNYHPKKCDVSNENDVKNLFSWVESSLGGTDILINNAGILHFGVALTDADNSSKIRDTVNINVMGAMNCVREAFNSMKKRSVDGHVVIVNSVAGHSVPNFPGRNIYPATKHAITAMTETYRQEFANAGTKVKVTSISPGAVDTEILPDNMKEMKIPMLKAKDISDAIMYVISTPPHVQVHELTLQAVGAYIPEMKQQ